MFPNSNKIQIWKILKQFIGKDLTKVSLPVAFNEPLSFLEASCTWLEYQELIIKANEI